MERADKSGNMNLWWCSLDNGLPLSAPNWQNMNLNNQGIATIPFYNLTGICIFNNSLIVNYNTGSQNNLVIPLLSNSSNPSNPISTEPTTTFINGNSNGNTNASSVTEPTNSIESSNNSLENSILSEVNTTTIPNTTNTDNTNYLNVTTTNPNTNPLNTYSNSSTNQSNSKNSSTANDTTKSNQMNITSGAGALLNGIGLAAQNGIRTELGIQGVNGNLGNKDNINDFMKDANLLGNNIYVSPMNNDQLYNPQAKLSQLGKITSSFFPMIKIAQ